MQFVRLIREAELKLFFAHGKGVGAILLAGVAIYAIAHIESVRDIVAGFSS